VAEKFSSSRALAKAMRAERNRISGSDSCLFAAKNSKSWAFPIFCNRFEWQKSWVLVLHKVEQFGWPLAEP
jgi:hypothetical protein